MSATIATVEATTSDSFAADVLDGLSRPKKQLPCKHLYDARGSQLFEQICELDEYYPTRTELAIMEAYVDRMAHCIDPKVRLVEMGAGSGRKTEVLLAALDQPAAYLPVDISASALEQCASRLRAAFEELEILPVCDDYTARIDLPRPETSFEATAAYFPGSTLGNFSRQRAGDFLARLASLVGDGGGVLIGIDLAKDQEVLERAYNDASGVTAAFNLNLLERIIRELDAEIDVDAFRHRAVWNEARGRIEMHLVSQRDQILIVEDHIFQMNRDEFIVTEHSHKYTPDGFEQMADAAGLQPKQMWTDERRWFSVW
ncbi:MAG: L-histidine N(alpha)-methyltransferase, partial [Persicimonas sp.]